MVENFLGETGLALWQARLQGVLYDGSAHPKSLDAAYEMQVAAIASSKSAVCGYKIGATTDDVLQLLELEEPFFGPLHARFNHESGADIPVHVAHQAKVEAEFVVCVGRDISRRDRDVAIDDVRDALEWIAPGFEIIGCRFKETFGRRGFCTIADFGSNLDIVVGSRCRNWQDLDFSDLPVSLSINHAPVATGSSSMSIVGNPLGIVAWLLNHERMRECGLRAGQIVSCGTCTGAIVVNPGDYLSADYGALGKIEATITAG